jgi:hypothetical protein
MNNNKNLICNINNKKIRDKCLIIGPLKLGDLFILNGAIRYYENIYNEITLLCGRDNYKNILSIFEDSNKINIICSDEKVLNNNHFIYNNYKDCDIIKLGIYNDDWDKNKSTIIINDLPLSFFITYYSQLGIEYEIRYKYEKINRDYENENIFYKKVMNSYNDKYIFVHNNDIFEILNLNNIPIFHPNINYYLYFSAYFMVFHLIFFNDFFSLYFFH